MYYSTSQMNEIQMYGLRFAFLAAMYAAYWFVTFIQLQISTPIPIDNVTKEQFAQASPNLDRAFRYLDYDPFSKNHPQRTLYYGQHISMLMLQHGWGGLTFLCLGAFVATYRAKSTALLIARRIAVIGFTVSLAVALLLHQYL